MELTKNEYAIAQALYSNVDIDSVLLSFRYIKYEERTESQEAKSTTQRLVSVREIHPEYITAREVGTGQTKRFSLDNIVDDSCKVLTEAI